MEVLSRNKITKALYVSITVVFYIQLLIVIALITLNYIDPIDKIITVRGDISVIENDWKPQEATSLSEFSEQKFLMSKSGFVRFDYKDWSKVFTLQSTAYLILTISLLFLYLFITYQLRKIFKSLTHDKIFRKENLNRIRNIGIVLLIIPLARFVSRLLFASYASDLMLIEEHHIGAKGWINDLPFVLFAILVFMLVAIFKAGLELEKEKE